MNGTVLNIVTRWDNFYKYDVVVENTSKGIEFRGGYAACIFTELAWMLNFTYTFQPQVGTYEFHKIKKYGIDMFVGSYAFFKTRTEFADSTFVTGSSKIIAVFDHTFEDSNSFNFLQPFKYSLWIAIVFLIISLPLCFVILGIFEKYKVSEMVLHGLSLALQKNTDLQLKTISGRTLSFTIVFATLILCSSYNGSLYSFLAVKMYTIISLEGLLNSKYKILLERGINDNNSVIQEMLRYMDKEPLAKIILQKAEESGFSFETYSEAIKKVGSSPVSLVIDGETAYEAVGGSRSMPCSWSTMSVLGISYPWTMFLKKGANFRAHINSGLLKLDERGVLKRARNTYLPTGSECSSTRIVQSSQQTITIDQILSAFWLYGLGILSALSFCGVEKIYAIISFV